MNITVVETKSPFHPVANKRAMDKAYVNYVNDKIERFLAEEKGWWVFNQRTSPDFRDYFASQLVIPEFMAARDGLSWWVVVKEQETGYLSGQRGFLMSAAEFDSWKDLQSKSKTPVRFVFLDADRNLYCALLNDLDTQLISYRHELSSAKPRVYLPLSAFITLATNFGDNN